MNLFHHFSVRVFSFCRNFILSSALLLLMSFCAAAQNSSQKVFGGDKDERANVIKATPDGGYILAGETGSFASLDKDAYLVKLDKEGNIQWSRSYGGEEKENMNDLRVTPDGGYILVGEKYRVGNKGELGSLIKTDKNGNIIWSNTFDSRGREAEGFSIQIMKDGGYIIGGMMKEPELVSDVFFPMKTEREHLFLLKTDAKGYEQWSGYLISESGTVGSKGRSVVETKDGGLLITGHVYTSAEPDFTKNCLIKFDKSGNKLWSKVYQGVGKKEESGAAVKQTNDGGFIVVGSTTAANSNESDVFLMKTGADGSVIWAKSYGGAKIDYGQDVEELPDGGFIITGSTNSSGAGTFDVLLIRTDKNGNLLWTKTFGGTRYDAAFNVEVSPDGFILTGFTLSFGNSGSSDVYIVITDKNGNSGCNEATVTFKSSAINIGTNVIQSDLMWNRIDGEPAGSTKNIPDLTKEKASSPQTIQKTICQ